MSGPPRRVTAQIADGTALGALLWLPEHGEPSPALVVYHPYRNDYADGLLLDEAHAFFADHGYAALMVDFRGLGASGGTFVGGYGRHEGRDGAQLVDWVARQDWCNGSVGMWGMSWAGMAALRTAAEAPASLRAVGALMAPLDVHDEMLRPGGCRACMVEPVTAANMLALQLLPSLDDVGRASHGAPRRVVPLGLDRHEASAGRSDLVPAERIVTPTYVVGGWRDIALRGSLATFARVRGPRRLTVGPWAHTYPDVAKVEPVDHLHELLGWWDRWLRRGAPGVGDESCVTYYCQPHGGWRACAVWPPATVTRTMWLDRACALSCRPVHSAGTERHLARVDVGISAARWRLDAVPYEQSDDDAGSLCFTSAPTRERLELAGSPLARLHLEVDDGDELQIVARLSDVSPGGRSHLITVGQRVCQAPTSMRQLEIELAPTAYAVLPGHRLRLAISAGEFPFLWPVAAASAIRVEIGRSVLHLPVLVGSAPGGDPPAPQGEPPARRALRDDRSSTIVERELETGRVSVTSRDVARLVGRDGRSPIDIETTGRATIDAARPAHATAEATARVKATTAAGASVRLETHCRMTRAQARLEGAVELDGQRVADESWQS
jgi:uncharacterized protein